MRFLNKRHPLLKWSLALVAIFLTLTLILAGTYTAFTFYFAEKIVPGTYIAGINVSGLTQVEAGAQINKKIDAINQEGIIFSYHNQSAKFLPIIASVEGDFVYQVLSFDPEPSITQAINFGKSEKHYKNFADILKNLFYRSNFKIAYEINEEKLNDFLKDNFSHFATPAKNAELIYEKQNDKTIDFKVRKEEYGQILDYNKAFEDLKKQLAVLNFNEIEIRAVINYPKIYEKDCLNIEAKARNTLNRFPLTLFHKNNEFIFNKENALDFLTLKEKEREIIVGLDLATTSAYLEKNIAPKINIEPIAAKFEIVDGKVKEFQLSRDGEVLDTKISALRIEDTLINSSSTKIELTVRAEQSEINGKDINDFGIKEILGSGHSSFAGSPKNRRHNIEVGAESVNGILIKPGEEFSLIKTLGEINAESGYLPELVIKDNKTIPEYGGGLCQIGTTVFRATYDSGLPITMRRNHSYRVSYYEPAGTDATIYDPWPDYRFSNDTQNHVLIQARIDGDDLYFDFWGTPDGRVATHTYPVIYNIIKPGPTRIIETEDLKPGERKCTEKPHNGADAYFDYTVQYPKNNPPQIVKEKLEANEEVKESDYTIETRFRSHYVPWREVCLVGIDKTENETASSSEEKINI